VFVWGFGWSSVTTLWRLKIVITATATCQQGKTVAELLTRNFQEYLDHVAVPAPGGSTLQWARQKICCAWHLFNCYRPTVIVDSSPYFWNSIFWILQALIPNPIQSNPSFLPPNWTRVHNGYMAGWAVNSLLQVNNLSADKIIHSS